MPINVYTPLLVGEMTLLIVVLMGLGIDRSIIFFFCLGNSDGYPILLASCMKSVSVVLKPLNTMVDKE